MILETVLILFMWPFHHKEKPKGPSPEQARIAKLIDEDAKIIADGVTGAQAFEQDTQYSKFERSELDDFEHQLFTCMHDTDPQQLDKDVDTLIEKGNSLLALDEILHTRNVI